MQHFRHFAFPSCGSGVGVMPAQVFVTHLHEDGCMGFLCITKGDLWCTNFKHQRYKFRNGNTWNLFCLCLFDLKRRGGVFFFNFFVNITEAEPHRWVSQIWAFSFLCKLSSWSIKSYQIFVWKLFCTLGCVGLIGLTDKGRGGMKLLAISPAMARVCK